jgi:hypothetical protein
MVVWRPKYRPGRLLRGVDNYYESPATEPKLQGCSKDHAIKVIQIRNICSEEAEVFRLLLPHIPYDPIWVSDSAPRFLVPLLNFRKIIFYADFKKSTHRHTKVFWFCTFFSNLEKITKAKLTERYDVVLVVVGVGSHRGGWTWKGGIAPPLPQKGPFSV